MSLEVPKVGSLWKTGYPIWSSGEDNYLIVVAVTPSSPAAWTYSIQYLLSEKGERPAIYRKHVTLTTWHVWNKRIDNKQ